MHYFSFCFTFRTVCPLKMSSSFRPNVRTPGKESDSPLPSIHEQLACLHPSRELLEFYREKIVRYDEEHGELLQMLEKHRGNTDDQVRDSKSMRLFGEACVCAPVLARSLFRISCSRFYDSVRGRLWLCRLL